MPGSVDLHNGEARKQRAFFRRGLVSSKKRESGLILSGHVAAFINMIRPKLESVADKFLARGCLKSSR
jgi:hypothetical protein